MTVSGYGGYGDLGDEGRDGGGFAFEPEGATAEKEPENLNVHRKAMGRLKRDGLARRVDVALKQRGGRRGTREFAYFLSDARKAESIVRGARACGIKAKAKAKNDYGHVGLPGNHTRVRNDLYIAMIVRAREVNAQAGQTVVDVPVEDMWAESCPDFPLRGEKITRDEGGKKLTGFDLQKAGYVAIEPDGRFRSEWPRQGFAGADLSCTYDVELELGIRPDAVMEKMDERAACYWRLFKTHRDRTVERLREKTGQTPTEETFLGLPGGFVPVLFLFKTDATARNMRDRVLGAVREKDEALRSFEDLQMRPEIKPEPRTREDGRQYLASDVFVGRYFLFAGLDRLSPESGDPFVPVFWPLMPYPMDLAGAEGRVSLEAVARERAENDRRKVGEGGGPMTAAGNTKRVNDAAVGGAAGLLDKLTKLTKPETP